MQIRIESFLLTWRLSQNMQFFSFSGLAVDNPNFEKITGDWRERVRKAKLRALTDAQ